MRLHDLALAVLTGPRIRYTDSESPNAEPEDAFDVDRGLYPERVEVPGVVGLHDEVVDTLGVDDGAAIDRQVQETCDAVRWRKSDRTSNTNTERSHK